MLPSDALPQDPLTTPAADPNAATANPMVTIPMDDDTTKKWQSAIKRADERRKVFEPVWERNLKAYTPDPTDAKWGEEVNPGVDFYQTEQKKDQLFFDTPTVILTLEQDTNPAQAQPTLAHQTKLNRKLGRTDLDCKRLFDQVLVDIICPSGMGCIKVGVTRITKDVPVPFPQGHPQAGQPNPEAGTAPVPVYQRIFGERFSPKKALIPTNHHSTEYDKSPWLGEKFTMPWRLAKRQFNLPDTIDPPKAKDADKQVFTYAGVKPDTETDEDEVTGTEIWYHASVYDDAVWHPDQMRQLVFIDGIDGPVVHRDSPYQTLGPDGTFTPDSMIGNPICIVTTRDLPDSPYVPSDCTITRPLVKELALFRTQLINQRDASTSIRIGNEGVLGKDVVNKIVRGPHGSIIMLGENEFAKIDPAHPPVIEIAHAVMSRENFQSQDIIERDISKVNTISANQTGADLNTTRSATEASLVQRSTDVRMQSERNRIESAFLALVTKIDALVKRYEAVPGQPQLPAYSYDIKPDSGVHVDAAADRKFALDRYNMLAKDPNVNRKYMLGELAPSMHFDPTQLIVEPPPPGPPEPSTSIIVKTDSLNPLAPEYANTIQLLTQLGFKLQQTPITPDLMQNAALAQPLKPPPHGGTPEHPEPVSKRSAEEVGHPGNLGGMARPM